MQSSNISRAFNLSLRTSRTDVTRSLCHRSVQLTTAVVTPKIFQRHLCALLHKPIGRLFTNIPHLKLRTYTSQTTDIIFPDPNRPDLYYHFMYPPTPLSHALPAFALSFLETTPPSVDSPTIIGWLPAQTYSTDSPDGTASGSTRLEGASSILQDFVVNEKFITFLHETIKSTLEGGLDEIWKDAATGLGKGWMHIHDQRNIPALGRVGDPDDILASVLIVNGKIQPETYQPMPSYRICTVDGVLQLTPGLAKHLKENLVKMTKSSSN